MLSLPVYVQSLRQEVRRLRVHNALLLRSHKTNQDAVKTLKQEIRKLKQERRRLEKERNRLEKELEKLTKTTSRYRASLFDHGNFKAPDHAEKKAKGGQIGHADTNREHRDDAASFVRTRLFLDACPRCQRPVRQVSATQEKQLVDIVLNPQVVKLIVESERQWCGNCRKEVSATDECSLPFTEYGINTFMMAMLLRYRCLLSLSKISLVFSVGYGLAISESGLVSLFRQARQYLGHRYEELKAIVRRGEMLYTDETGWHVGGQGAWMWIMASDEATVYVAAESRGKGIAREMYGTSQAYAMHDGYAAYASVISDEKNLYCWSHMLRFAHEETALDPPGSDGVHIRDALVAVYQQKRTDPLMTEDAVRERMQQLLALPARTPSATAIRTRLLVQQEGLVTALFITPNGTNNFAEQELRPMALARRISYGSDTYTGMETTAVLASVVQTIMRTNQNEFFPLLQASLREGFAKP